MAFGNARRPENVEELLDSLVIVLDRDSRRRSPASRYRGSTAAVPNYVVADRGRADDYYLTEGTG
jgi:hypothetical protein